MNAIADEAASVVLEAPWAFVALAAGVLVVACAIRARRSAGVATLVWAALFAAIALFFAVWCALGLCATNPATYCLCQGACALFGIVVLGRDRMSRELSQLGAEDAAWRRLFGIVLPWIRDIVLVLFAAWASFHALEMADNLAWRDIDSRLFDLGFQIVLLASAVLYFLGQRHGVACVPVPVVCSVFGLVQVFLDLFKNTALLPSDVMAWQTAAAVSGGYTFTLPSPAISSITYAVAALGALAFVVPPCSVRRVAGGQRGLHAAGSHNEQPVVASGGKRPVSLWRRVAGIAANLACCALCAFGLWSCTFGVDYLEKYDLKLDYWDLRNSYHEHGFLVSFIAAAQDLVIDEPQGYSDEEAAHLEEILAQRYDKELAPAHEQARKAFIAQQPSVIAIMNESYADLSLFEDLHDGYTGTFVTQGLDDAQVDGWLGMSVHGGGTCNSEYEFLAFSSMGLLSSGMYPYQQFKFDRIATLPSRFKQLGYGTWAMHPNYPGNWNREFVYATMGFDSAEFIYDFEGADQFHDCVSDRATYDRALEILKDTDGAQFILDITMQNHGGYDTGTIPANQMTDIKPDFLDEAQTAALNEYLSCIRCSDEAIEYLLDELAKLDEPVAVVFFGDHQPSMTRDYNDALFPDEGDLDHKARITKTPYFIWTNYNVPDGGRIGSSAGKREPADKRLADGAQMSLDAQTACASSANYLGAQLLELIGAPLSPYEKAILVLHQQICTVNTNGFCDGEGAWHDASEGEAQDHPYHQLQMLHYLNVVRKL